MSPETLTRVGRRQCDYPANDGIFCGSAGITAEMKRIGLRASFGIDSTLHAVRKGPVIRLDLSTESSQHLLFRMLQSSRLLIVWVAPPCGTASRAREIPLPNCNHQPPVLRTDSSPDGLENLEPHLLLRIARANAMYDLTAAVCILCTQNKVAWITENPSNSLFWRTSMWQQVHQQCNPLYVHHHACVYGSQRKKSTVLACQGIPQIKRICKQCDGQHLHLQWGIESTTQRFATALEVSYPHKLCQEVAACVQDYATSQGIQILPQDLAQASDTPQADDDCSRAFASQGTTKLRLPQLMPEYKQILHVCLPAEVCVWPLKSYLQGPRVIGPHFLPENTRVLSMQPDTEGVEVALPANKCTFGIPWTPHKFIKEAALRGHPNSLSLAIPPELKSAIWSLATSPPDQVAQLRAAFFKKWMNKASELHEQELGLKESMDPELKKIVQNKKIIIFEQMINEYQIADKEAPKILSEGVDMAGRIPASDNLPRQFFPATVPEEDLEALGPVLNEAACPEQLLQMT